MDWSNSKTNVYTDNTRRSVSIHRNLQWAWAFKSHDYKQNHRGSKYNRHNKYLLAIKTLCLSALTATVAAPVNAETVGGVSATASPIANSSGSVTNQAIQVLQGPYITNTYGGGIQCQGPTMNFTPYVTGSISQQKPWEPMYNEPVYDMRDLDEDGSLDNPGAILYHVPTRTGQKDNYNIGLGFSATWSKPLDKNLQDQCKKAAATQIALQEQLTANKRLDFEIARLKNCGQLIKEGISFHPKSPYYKICADVVVRDVTYIKPHVHSIPSPSTSSQRDSSDAALLGGPLTTGQEQISP